MTATKSKKEVQREQTHRGLIEVAESLFAEHGISAVSLRQIGEHAGSFNTNVVGYYFGSKEALIEAIYRHRLPQIELWRAQFLKDMDGRGRSMNLRELLQLIWLPWFEQHDKDGRHSYGRFLFSIDREGLGWTREVLDPDYPASFEAHSRIKRFLQINRLPNPDFRFAMQITMILKTLYYIDRNGLAGECAKALFLDALDMAEASLMSGA